MFFPKKKNLISPHPLSSLTANSEWANMTEIAGGIVINQGFVVQYPFLLTGKKRPGLWHKDNRTDCQLAQEIPSHILSTITGEIFNYPETETEIILEYPYIRPIILNGSDGKEYGYQTLDSIFTRTDFSQFFHEAEKAEAEYGRIFSEGSVTGYHLGIRYHTVVYRDCQGVFSASREMDQFFETGNIGQTSESYEDTSRKPPPKRSVEEKRSICNQRICA